jgi:hyperosmotically inducible protein
MVKTYRRLISLIAVSVLLSGLAGTAGAADAGGETHAGITGQSSSLAEQVRYKIVTLPFLSVFDNLHCTVMDSNTVVLTGQVVRPTMKKDAEAVARSVPGVKKVVNNIEVLPLSPVDDTIRLRTYRAIYLREGFEKYAIQALLPIRIIVKNGNITLEGMVSNQMDKTMAEMAAKSVPGAFSVTDNLTIG